MATPHPIQSTSSQRRLPILGLRRWAQDLARDYDALHHELARLRQVVETYAIEDALTRTIALEDLAAEQAIQERRLRDLIERAHDAELAGQTRDFSSSCASVS